MSAGVAAPEDSIKDTDPGTAIAPVVEAELADFLARHERLLLAIHPDLGLLFEVASFAYWGWRSALRPGAAGEADLLRAAASLELLHACALVHDDVMDASDTRRGQPAAHVRFASEHATQGWPADAQAFGRSGAILLGDLLLSWAEEMFTAAIDALPARRAVAAQREFDLMRTEVVAGQFLDVLAQTRGAFEVDEALRVIEFKTSKYTIQRPLLLGAAAAGARGEVATALAAYGHALGEAFQLRDDLLGVFGDPELTGKPAGDDLREGKRTLLVALANAAADPAQRAALEAGIGDQDLDAEGVRVLRGILTATGAREAVEHRISAGVERAERALQSAPIRSDALTALLELAHAAAHRSF
jgi:geranylgeranyl diphosphate synthase type I